MYIARVVSSSYFVSEFQLLKFQHSASSDLGLEDFAESRGLSACRPDVLCARNKWLFPLASSHSETLVESVPQPTGPRQGVTSTTGWNV